MHIDGASDRENRGVGIILKRSNGVTIKYSLKLEFKTTNNITEYEALVKRLELAKGMKPEKLRVYNNSLLVIGQVSGQFKSKKEKTAKYQKKKA